MMSVNVGPIERIIKASIFLVIMNLASYTPEHLSPSLSNVHTSRSYQKHYKSNKNKQFITNNHSVQLFTIYGTGYSECVPFVEKRKTKMARRNV
jgi:hypothetical protein